MHIKFPEHRLRNYKSHRHLDIQFGHVTRIVGTNGAGKSSIGESIPWTLYGVDTLGSKTDPTPIYDHDRVEGHLLVEVDGKLIQLSRIIEKSKTAYYINEVPKKAKEFDELVASLFDKNLFLSLFSPAYFFSQHWEEQRKQLLQYVTPPVNTEVLAALPKPQAEKLGPLFKQKKITDLEAQHKDNKNRQDKALIAAKERVRTLEEQQATAVVLAPEERERLTAELADIDAELAQIETQQRQAGEMNRRINQLQSRKDGTAERAEQVRQQYQKVKDTLIADACDKCGQMLDEKTRETVEQHKTTELALIKAQHAELLDKHKALKAELAGLTLVEVDPAVGRELHERRSAIKAQLTASEAGAQLGERIAEAKQHEQTTHASFQESVFILDAIKAFKAKEAELMAANVGGLFKTLKLQLFQTNKGDGEQKPFFEVEMDGKPYRKLSTAEKIRAGLELIDVLSQQSGVVAPVFVDNAESILRYKQPAGQLIECRVADQNFTVEAVT